MDTKQSKTKQRRKNERKKRTGLKACGHHMKLSTTAICLTVEAYWKLFYAFRIWYRKRFSHLFRHESLFGRFSFTSKSKSPLIHCAYQNIDLSLFSFETESYSHPYSSYFFLTSLTLPIHLSLCLALLLFLVYSLLAFSVVRPFSFHLCFLFSLLSIVAFAYIQQQKQQYFETGP